MDIIQSRSPNDLPAEERTVALQLLNEWDPSDPNRLNFWVSGRGYSLSWREHPDAHVLKFRRNWLEGEDQECNQHLVFLEATVIKDVKTRTYTQFNALLYSGHANGWTYHGPLSDLYHTQDELDAWRNLRDRIESVDD